MGRDFFVVSYYRYLMKVENGYQDNPYHNAVHAADVTSRLAAILQHTGIADDLMKSRLGRYMFHST